jgi:hypothetical protein
MTHTVQRNSFKVSWALALGLTASTLLSGYASAEPATTTDTSSAAMSGTIRDQWYLDPVATEVTPAISAEATDTNPAISVEATDTTPAISVEATEISPAISAQARDSWYLEHSAPARSHRTQEDA